MNSAARREIPPEAVRSILHVDQPAGAHLLPIAEAAERGAIVIMATYGDGGRLQLIRAAPLTPRGTVVLLGDDAGGGPDAFDSLDLTGLARWSDSFVIVTDAGQQPDAYADAGAKSVSGRCAVLVEASGEAAGAWAAFLRTWRHKPEPALQL